MSDKNDSNDSSATTASSSDSATSAMSPAHEQTLVQYIVMRSDLSKAHKWNAGGLIANGSHASVAVIAEHWQDADVQQYVTGAGGKQMHTVVLAAKDEQELMDTASLLQKNSIAHKLWVSHTDHTQRCCCLSHLQSAAAAAGVSQCVLWCWLILMCVCCACWLLCTCVRLSILISLLLVWPLVPTSVTCCSPFCATSNYSVSPARRRCAVCPHADHITSHHITSRGSTTPHQLLPLPHSFLLLTLLARSLASCWNRC